MSNRIIMVSGLKRSGKDTVSHLLAEKLDGKVVHFAAPMKSIVSTTFGITLIELEYAKNNGQILAFLKYGRPLFLFTNFRKILQRFGSEAMKPWFGDDVWKKLLPISATTTIVADYRFPAEHIDGAITIQVVRDSVKSKDIHISETALDDTPAQYVVYNNGTLTQLEDSIDFLLTTNEFRNK